MILGHEGLGVVHQVNQGRTDFLGKPLKEGDLVVWDRGVLCKRCHNCLLKRKNYLCKDRWVYGFSKSINEYPHVVGSYSSHMLLTPETDIMQIIPADKMKSNEDLIP